MKNWVIERIINKWQNRVCGLILKYVNAFWVELGHQRVSNSRPNSNKLASVNIQSGSENDSCIEMWPKEKLNKT